MSDRFKNNQCNQSAGFSLVEAVIAIAIISLILGGIVMTIQTMVVFEGQTLKKRQASLLADQGLEVVRVLRDSGWTANVAPLTTNRNYYLRFNAGAWQATTTVQTNSPFYRTISLAPVYRDVNSRIASAGTLDTNTKLITVTVAWPYRSATSTMVTSGYLTNLFAN